MDHIELFRLMDEAIDPPKAKATVPQSFAAPGRPTTLNLAVRVTERPRESITVFATVHRPERQTYTVFATVSKAGE